MNVNKERMTAWLQQGLGKAAKFKYAILILLLGVVLLLLPQKKTAASAAPEPQAQETQQRDLEAQLEALLSQVEGAGEVRVLLTMETSEAYEYQTDVETKTSEDSMEQTQETVLASAGSGTEGPLTVKTTYPIYKGAVVLCQGADSAAVRLAMVQAVSSLTGLSSDKITVIKMKQD